MLDNPNNEAFVQKWHQTGNKSEAYRYAFPKCKKWKDETVHNKAYALSKKGEVLARFKQLQEKAEKRHNVTVDSLLAELDENRITALSAETPQCSAANQSTMGKARLCGLDSGTQDDKEAPPLTINFEVKESAGEIRVTKGSE